MRHCCPSKSRLACRSDLGLPIVLAFGWTPYFPVLYDIGVFNIFVLSNNLPLNELNSRIAFNQLLVFRYFEVVALTPFTSNILDQLAGNDIEDIHHKFST